MDANLTFDGAEGRWKVLQASEIYERRASLSEVYRNALARRLRGLAYETENQRDAGGHDAGFEIKGIPAELLAKFSQRSLQWDQAIEAFVAQHGRKPTDNEVADLVRESRADRLTEISTHELRERQRARLARKERDLLQAMCTGRRCTEVAVDRCAPSVECSEQHIFERISVARDHAVLTEALRHGRGEIQLAELSGELSLRKSTGKLLRPGRRIATATSLEREQEMIAAINRRVGYSTHLAAIVCNLARSRVGSPVSSRNR